MMHNRIGQHDHGVLQVPAVELIQDWDEIHLRLVPTIPPSNSTTARMAAALPATNAASPPKPAVASNAAVSTFDAILHEHTGAAPQSNPQSNAEQARKGWQIRTRRLRGGRGLGGAVRGGRDGPIESRPRRYLVDQAPLAPARAAFATCSVISSSEPPPAESTARSLRGWLDYEFVTITQAGRHRSPPTVITKLQ